MTLTLSRVRLTGALFTLVVAVLVGARVHAVSVRTVLPILPSDAIFNDTVVHEIRLDINAKDWQTLRDNYLTNEYYPCDFRWNGQVVRNVGIRSRGQASRSATKPSLRVDFNRYTASQTLLDLKSVVLRNNSTDFSSMHERVAMLLYARMGLPAPRVAHARLYINNTYQGLYSIVESLDKSFLSRNFDQNDGYLYKYDRLPTDPPYYLDYLGPSASSYSPHPFNPETHEDNPKPQPIADLIRTVHDATDGSFRTAIAQYLDVSQFIRNIAVTVYMGDEDGFLGNWGMNNLRHLPAAELDGACDHPVGQERSHPFGANLFDLPQHQRRAGLAAQPPDGAFAGGCRLPESVSRLAGADGGLGERARLWRWPWLDGARGRAGKRADSRCGLGRSDEVVYKRPVHGGGRGHAEVRARARGLRPIGNRRRSLIGTDARNPGRARSCDRG